MQSELSSSLSQGPAERLSPGLYIVATPIGNLADLSPRAADWLRRADLIAAEDSRQTAKLLAHIGSSVPMTPYHDHNADAVRPRLLQKAATAAVALVSDAGTPLISDPGFKLVREAYAQGVAVTTAPGPCAAIAALSLAGLPTDRFLFMGFLPTKAGARAQAVQEVRDVRATLIFYEAARRADEVLALLAEILGPRPAAVVREITKTYEEVLRDDLPGLAARLAAQPVKGEVVIVVGPPTGDSAPDGAALDEALRAALADMPLKTAVAHVVATLHVPRKVAYARALALRDVDNAHDVAPPTR